MKEFTQYASLEEVVSDMIAEGIMPRNKKIRSLFPGVKARPQRVYVDRLKAAILDKIGVASLSMKPALSRARLYRAVRGDNYPEQFNTAIDQLIAERKISAEVLQTKGRPFTHYHAFEF